MTAPGKIRIGTRASALARWQANWVAERLAELDVDVEIVLISTSGDQNRSGPIGTLGQTGVFTKEIQRALLDETVDLAVHSLKDLPTEAVEGLSLAAVPPRERCGDVLISRDEKKLPDLPERSRIGTGSLRRQAQLKHMRSDLHVADIRGNVETRIAKLDAGDYDAIVLAEAGLLRLGLADRITEIISKDRMLPAIGQGALGLETRANDKPTREALKPLDDQSTHASVLAERSLLATLRGGCLAPVGAWGRLDDAGELKLDAVVLSRDGQQCLHAAQSGDLADAKEIGSSVATELLKAGAADLIQLARSGE